jgi:hypothetical protein
MYHIRSWIKSIQEKKEIITAGHQCARSRGQRVNKTAKILTLKEMAYPQFPVG